MPGCPCQPTNLHVAVWLVAHCWQPCLSFWSTASGPARMHLPTLASCAAPPLSPLQDFVRSAPPVPCTMARNSSLVFRWYSGSLPAGELLAWAICSGRQPHPPLVFWQPSGRQGGRSGQTRVDSRALRHLCPELLCCQRRSAPNCCYRRCCRSPPPPAGLLTATDCGQMTGDSVVTILSSPAPEGGPFSCEG